MGRLRRIVSSDLAYSFRHSLLAMSATLVFIAIGLAAVGADLLAPHRPFDLATLNLMDSLTPPAWAQGGSWTYPLGTDDQGRDILSTILYGARVSLLVGVASVVMATMIGVLLGLIAGYVGGLVDIIVMRVAEVQLTFPALLIALLIDGILRTSLPRGIDDDLAIIVLIAAIGLSNWVQYARTVRGLTLVEKSKDYVQAAEVIGVHPVAIMVKHILPNVSGPVLVIATIGLALAIGTEATLSFLGLGIPPTQPSLGTLIRIGNDFLFSGEWWIVTFPSIALVAIVISVNLIGDWLRDALNPKLR